MGQIRGIFAVLSAIAVAILFMVAGFAVCILPPVTQTLSNTFAKDAISPFNRTQLVQVADATRDFSFGSHNELALYQTIYRIDDEYRQAVESSGGEVAPDFPRLDEVGDINDLAQLKQAFAGASELYCYSENTVAHLEDCHRIMTRAIPIVVLVAIIAILGLAFTGMTNGSRWVGRVFAAAGIITIIAFIGLAVWAFIDFNGFFRAFHQLVFTQGNWEFPFDSLLICALPVEFWMGMGGVWIGVSFLVSIIASFVGRRMK